MLKIGIAGLNRGASFIGLINRRNDACVAAVCAADDERDAWADRLGVPGFAEFGELCDSGVDAIIVATPPILHAEHCIEALDAGKHVLSEVPAVYRLEEAAPLVEAVRRSGKTYMFAENMCYFSYIRTMQALVEQGRIGELTYAEGEYVHDLRPLLGRPDGIGGGVDGKPTWRAGLPPIHYCTHDLGPILMMMQDRVVSATGLHTGSRIAPELGSIDIETGLFGTAKGNVIKIMCAFTVERPGFHWVCLYGTKGSMEMDRFHPYDRLKAYFGEMPDQQGMIDIPVSLSDPNAPAEAAAGGHGTSEYYMIDDFVRAAVEGAQPELDVYTGLEYTLPGICAHLSAERGGEAVAVPDVRAV